MIWLRSGPERRLWATYRARPAKAGDGLGVLLAALALGLSGCAGTAPESRYNRSYGVSASPRVVLDGRPIPKGGGTYKIGTPYQIAGRWYFPREEPNYDRVGIASWYGADFHGRKTANGEIYDMTALTAAHPTLPLPSYAYVTNEATGRTLLVRINDRGPYANDRIIDLSQRAARLLGFEAQGLARVRVRYAGPAPLNGDDRHELAFLARQPWGEPAPWAAMPRQRELDGIRPVAMRAATSLR